MNKVTLPYGGTLLWNFTDFTYTGNIAYRDIQSRQLQLTSTGSAFSTHSFQHDRSGDASRSHHSWGRVDDTSGSNASKIWYFGASAGGQTGLVSQYKQYQISPYSELLIRDYTWTTSSSGNPYINSVITTQDGIQSDTPREAGGLMSWAASKAVGQWV